MGGARFRIYNKSKLFASITAVCVVFFLFGCGPAKIIKGQKAPQGTYECIRGYDKMTCPTCSGRGSLQIAPWEQQSQETSSRKKSKLLGALAVFSSHKSPGKGYKTCYQCGGHGIVCKRDESAALPASSAQGSREETKIREKVYMARSYRDFILIDKFDSPVGDVFYAAAVPRPLESGTADIPIDAITYGLTEFAGLEKNYKFFGRFASSIKKGVAIKGQCIIRCIYNGNPMNIRFCYYPKYKHLEVQAGPPLDEKVYAIDLSKVDVSIDEKKDKDSAIRNSKKVIPNSKFSKKAAIQTALLYRKEGKIEEAVNYLNDVLKKIPDDPDLLLCLGYFYRETKEFEKAEIALKRGLAIDPDNSRLHFYLGDVYCRWGREKAAIEEMKTVITLDPQNAHALNYLGYTYAKLGENLDEAERLIKQALKQKPDNGYIIDSLGFIYFKKGLFNEALKYFEKAVSLVPDNPRMLEHLGDAYLKIGDNKKALDFYKRSLSKKEKDKADLEKKIRELIGK